MAITLNGFNSEADSSPLVEYVPAVADTTPQAYADTQKMHRNRQTAALGEPIADNDFDARWADFDREDYTTEVEQAQRLVEDAIAGAFVESLQRKASGRKPNEPGSKTYDRYHGSSTGGKATHKTRNRQDQGVAIEDLVQIGAPRGQAIAWVSPKNGSRAPRI